jgi:DNA damage-binding protein 1
MLDVYQLHEQENSCSVVSTSFGEDVKTTKIYYVVGTALANPLENEPQEGRILIFEVVERKLRLVCSKDVKGAAYQVRGFNGKLLAAINCKIELFGLRDSEGHMGQMELTTECVHRGHILVLYLQTRGDFIVVGDLMRSISLLTYKPVDGQMEEIAQDYNSNWMTAIDILDE